MKKEIKGFIRRIFTPRSGNTGHINTIFGKDRQNPENTYQNTKGDREYWTLAGGLGWPAQDGSCEGYGVIVGVTKTKPLTYVALAECTAPTPEELIDACVALRKDWGFGFPDILKIWRGDPERFPDWNLKNVELTKDNPDNGFIISHFLDSEAGNAFEIWLQTIRRLTRPGKSQVFTKDCPILRRTLHATPLKVCKKSLADYPIISAFAGLVHSLIREKPFLEYIERKRVIGTMPDPIFDDATEEEALVRELYGYEDDDDDYGDDGAGISTMPGG